MQDPLHTRETLLVRLRDQRDEASWAEFVEIYTPLLYAYCQKREIRENDTADIVQDVMRSVSLAMKGFEYDPAKGKFKAWLFTVLRHAISTYFRKESRAPVTARETVFLKRIETTPDESEEMNWERDYQLRLMDWALEKIKPEFAERIWTFFEETALKDREPVDVAAEFEVTKNAVNIAKCRVLKRLREKMEMVDADRWEQEMIRETKKS